MRETMDQLNNEIRECKLCEISQQTPKKVIGKGVGDPKYLFIGLNPGKEEMQEGIPFVGPSGKLLDRWIEYLGIKEDEYAVVNLIKCFTNNQSELNGEEVKNCKPFLEQQIEFLNPQYFILLGAIPVKTLMGLREITKITGKIFTRSDQMHPYHHFITLAHPSYYVRKGGHGWEEMLEPVKRFINNPQGVTESFNKRWDEVTPIQSLEVEIKEVDVDKKIKEVAAKVVKYPKEQSYVPIHVHDTFSIKDSCVQTKDLAKYAKEMGFKAIGETNHGSISGLYEFQQNCDKEGIKPILGVEFYVHDEKYGDDKEKRYHIVALCKNEIGLKNLFKLVDISYREKFYRKPRIELKDLFKYGDGLVITTACSSGIVAMHYLNGEPNFAQQVLLDLKYRFEDDLYVELQPHFEYKDQKKLNPMLIELANKYDIKTIITTDAHYLKMEDEEIHKSLKAIAYHQKFEEAGFGLSTNYLMSTEEIKKYSLLTNIDKDTIEKSLQNTISISDRCNARIEKYENALPKFTITEDQDDQKDL
jgi:uracil-DNA glycosylase family 4